MDRELTPGTARRHPRSSSNTACTTQAIAAHFSVALAPKHTPSRIIAPRIHALLHTLPSIRKTPHNSTQTRDRFLLPDFETTHANIKFTPTRVSRLALGCGGTRSCLVAVTAETLEGQAAFRFDKGREEEERGNEITKFVTPERRVLHLRSLASDCPCVAAGGVPGGRWAGSGCWWAGLWVGCARGGEGDHSTSHLRASNSCLTPPHRHTSVSKVLLNEIIKWRRRWRRRRLCPSRNHFFPEKERERHPGRGVPAGGYWGRRRMGRGAGADTWGWY
ncbi:hypothetical protein E2C01_043689 [Portunus trituberculatus]|uniref:Uncharacterized protein n=1 Tax=Portunus trituberculatus TaxID=210409 RepID=A0A5B7G083_PORTR|nr:hypothetical protein [Portunus trituberculatus]